MQTSTFNSGLGHLTNTRPVAGEMVQHYQPGDVKARPRYFFGRPKNSAVGQALAIGMFVIHSGVDIAAVPPAEGIDAGFEKCPAGRRPHGYLEARDGDSLFIRLLEGDVTVDGITAGSDYVVGTDSRPAKYGDSTYPSAVSAPVVIGRGWVANRLMLGASSGTAGSSLAQRITTDSSAVTANTRTAFNRTLTLDLSLLPIGGILEIEGMIKVVTANTYTMKMYLAIDGTDIFENAPIDPVNAGDLMGFSVKLLRRGAATFCSHGIAYTYGDVDGKRASGGGQRADTALTFGTAAVLTPGFSFSAADAANSAILVDLRTNPR